MINSIEYLLYAHFLFLTLEMWDKENQHVRLRYGEDFGLGTADAKALGHVIASFCFSR